MYNRYIPQPDGSYRKSRMQDASPRMQSRQSPPTTKKSNYPPPSPQQSVPTKKPLKEHHRSSREPDSILGFFRNLLPQDLDAGDLMVILLLLLISNDCEEDKNTALLTLALYFFM